MDFEYKSSNFLSHKGIQDRRLRIYDKNDNLKYSIEPDMSYVYNKNNCLIIKITNKNDITLTFENKSDAVKGMSRILEELMMYRTLL